MKWVARGPSYEVLLTPEGATFHLLEGVSKAALSDKHLAGLPRDLPPDAVRKRSFSAVQMKLPGGRPWTAFNGLEPTGGVTNYLLGSNPRSRHTGIQHFARLSVPGVYEGIDLVFYSNGTDLEYDFVVAPGADPKRIRLAFDGVERMQVESKSGDLLLTTAGGAELRHLRPKIYQQDGEHRVEIAGGYRILDRRQAALTLAAYDPGRPLIIDPMVSYYRTLHGDLKDTASDVAVDSSGNAWVTGLTQSFRMWDQDDGLPGAGEVCPAPPGTYEDPDGDIFLAQVSPTGTLLSISFIGGCRLDMGNSIAVDATGIYLTGFTDSNNFPQVNPLQPLRLADAFVLKLDPTGKTILYSTYLGGPSVDTGFGITVDSSGNAYVAGKTYTSGFPTVAPAQPNFGGVRDGFVAKLNPTGTALVYSTYLGGLDYEEAVGIAVDPAGHAYVTGMTFSANFPTRGASQPYPFGPSAFVTKLSPQGTAFIYSTYLGGGNDFGLSIAADASGNAYVTGATGSATFPTTVGAFQATKPSPDGRNSAFVTKFSSTGTRLLSTYFSGTDGETMGRGIAVNAMGEIYIGGMTSASSLPGWIATPDMPGQMAGFVTKLSPQLDQFRYTFGVGSQVSDIAVVSAKAERRTLPPPAQVYAVGWVFTFSTIDKFVDGFIVKMTEEFGM